MSETDTGANEPHDDAQDGEEKTITSLEEAQAAFEDVNERRETRAYRIPGHGTVEFTVRGLKADESDRIESIAAREQQKAEHRSRTGTTDDMDIWPVRRQQLEYGIVSSSIDDFRPTREDHLRMLPKHVQNDLFLAIDELGELETEVRDGFRSSG